MFLTKDLGRLNPEMNRAYLEMRKILLNPFDAQTKEWSRAYHTPAFEPEDPAMLELMDRAYRSQVLFEAAREVVLQRASKIFALQRFMPYMPKLVRHYHECRDHNMVVFYATARDYCVDPELDPTLEPFLDELGRLLVEKRWWNCTGGSDTGGMGLVSRVMNRQIQAARAAGEDGGVKTCGARLGMLVDMNQPPCEAIDHMSPPLYVFFIRMYYLGLIGAGKYNGSKKGKKSEPGKMTARVIARGGLGSLAEALSDGVESQLAGRVHTTHSHRLAQPYPQFVYVGNRVLDDAEKEASSAKSSSDAKLIVEFGNMVNTAADLQSAGVGPAERQKALQPHSQAIAKLMFDSRMFYRGLLLQVADALAATTVDGRDVMPIRFVSLVKGKEKQAAQETFKICTADRPSLRDIHDRNSDYRP